MDSGVFHPGVGYLTVQPGGIRSNGRGTGGVGYHGECAVYDYPGMGRERQGAGELSNPVGCGVMHSAGEPEIVCSGVLWSGQGESPSVTAPLALRRYTIEQDFVVVIGWWPGRSPGRDEQALAYRGWSRCPQIEIS